MQGSDVMQEVAMIRLREGLFFRPHGSSLA